MIRRHVHRGTHASQGVHELFVRDTGLFRVVAFHPFSAARRACSVIAKEATLHQVVAALVHPHPVASIAMRRRPPPALVSRHAAGDGEVER